jgi:hypothetical protein
MADDQQQPPPQQPDLNAAIQALIQQQIAAASGQGQQVQLPSATPPQSQYSNDPSKGPDLLERIGLALGGGSLPGAPAELRAQMGRQALLNFGIGLMGAGRFATPGEVFAGGLRGAQSGLLGSEAAQAGQQEYALNAQAKLAELGMQQQKNRTEALTALVPLLQMQRQLGLPNPLLGGGLGGPGGGGDGGDTAFTGDPAHDLPLIRQRESGGDYGAWNYVDIADPTAYARGATASGAYQIVNSTWREGMGLAGLDPNQYPTARSAPPAVQDKVAAALYAKHGTAPWDASKFGANWAKQPDGSYQLVKGAPPPASTAPTGPIKGPPTASTVAATPPGVQMGGPPPAPPGGSGGAYSGGGIGTALNPELAGRTPATVAPPPTTAAAAPPGMVRLPNGNIVTKGGGAFPGTRADADAILQGIQTAQATPVVRGTGEEAGPSGAVATLAQPPAAQPGWGAKVGTYDFGGPVGPITTTKAAPAAPAAAPAAGAPAPPPAAPAPAPAAPALPSEIAPADTADDKLSTPQFLTKYHIAPTAEQIQRMGVTSPQLAQDLADAEKAKAVAAQNVSLAMTDADRIKAQQGYDDANNKLGTLREKLGQDVNQNYMNFDQANDRLLSADHLKKQEIAANVALETQRQRGKLDEINATTGANERAKVLEKLNTDSAAAEDQIHQLQMVQELSAAAGKASVLGPDTKEWLTKLNLASPTEINQWSAQQALDAANQRLITALRAGTGFQRTTNMDLQFLQHSSPGGSQVPPEFRDATTAFLMAQARRTQQFTQLVQGYMSDGKTSYPDAAKKADDELGSLFKTLPSNEELARLYPNDPNAAVKWKWDNVRPGEFYKQPGGPSGRLAIFKPTTPTRPE